MSLKAQTHFNTIHNVWVITPHGATQQFGMLIFVHHAYVPAPPPDETPTLPPNLRPHHSLPFHTPASSSPWLTILTLLRALKLCFQCRPDPPLCLLAPAAYDPYACGVPSQHASDAAYHPYACGVPSRHASNSACIVPTQHASNAAYHPYARRALPKCL
ncbi:hypothetical protein O181_110771 [Austropuccinia psidii MF-1]|uniref:Uncharacterized protein n=1 Tax=Austropuccinia psidii MF-1 TaxID=1389203 RepID=A0A9Q3PS39_9BASI|nr:hypothetical protein [Austropuccinia psidii MF-1]